MVQRIIICCQTCSGKFELTLGAQFLAEYDDLDAIICLGCVIQGENTSFSIISVRV